MDEVGARRFHSIVDARVHVPQSVWGHPSVMRQAALESRHLICKSLRRYARFDRDNHKRDEMIPLDGPTAAGGTWSFPRIGWTFSAFDHSARNAIGWMVLQADY